jgi:hypothetical protein
MEGTIADFKGVVIAEGLDNPTIINRFAVYKATITEDGLPIDYDGHFGRWHIYYVKYSKKEINELQPHMQTGWYAHFWQGNKIIVVYNDKQFEIKKNDRSTWREAIEHGRAQGIPENEFGFPTD